MMKLKKNTMYVIGLVAILAIAVFIFRDKIFGEKKPETALVVKGGEYFHYRRELDQEAFRFRKNFVDFNAFKTAFINAIKAIISSKGLASKKLAFDNAKDIINLYLDDYPVLKMALKALITDALSPLQNLISSKLSTLFKADTKEKTKELIRNACDLSRKGQILTYIATKVINPVLDTILQDSKISAGFDVLSKIGINMRTILITIAEEKLKPFFSAAQKALSPALNTLSGRLNYPEGNIGNCAYDPTYAAMVNAPQFEINIDDALLDDIELFRYKIQDNINPMSLRKLKETRNSVVYSRPPSLKNPMSLQKLKETQ